MKLYNQPVFWLILIFLLINLNSYAEKSPEAIVPDKNSSEITRPGFRNIYLGMTRTEIEAKIEKQQRGPRLSATMLCPRRGRIAFIGMGKRSYVVAAGDSINGWEVFKVEKESVTLFNKERKEEVIISISKECVDDKQILFASPWFARTKVGPHPVDILFIYDNHAVLYYIGLFPPRVTADEIKTTLQRQIDFFYGVFRKRFGEPNRTRPSAQEISIFDFKGGFYVPLYSWVKDNVARHISLRMDDFEYGIAILIIDDRLAEIKRKEDEERKRIEQERVLDDF